MTFSLAANLSDWLACMRQSCSSKTNSFAVKLPHLNIMLLPKTIRHFAMAARQFKTICNSFLLFFLFVSFLHHFVKSNIGLATLVAHYPTIVPGRYKYYLGKELCITWFSLIDGHRWIATSFHIGFRPFEFCFWFIISYPIVHHKG